MFDYLPFILSFLVDSSVPDFFSNKYISLITSFLFAVPTVNS